MSAYSVSELKEECYRLGAIAFLNFRLRNPGISTQEYLARWKTVLPAQHKPFADKVALVFGYSLPN